MADAEKPVEEKPVAKAAETPESEGSPAPKKSKKKLFIIIGLVLVLALGGGAGFMYMKSSSKHSAENEEAQKEPPTYYTMPEMLINLAAPGKQSSFVKATIILELQHKLDAITVENNLPRLMDAFNTYVRELRPSDLAGSAGITRLREELVLRANKALDPVKVNDVLFKEILVQ